MNNKYEEDAAVQYLHPSNTLIHSICSILSNHVRGVRTLDDDLLLIAVHPQCPETDAFRKDH